MGTECGLGSRKSAITKGQNLRAELRRPSAHTQLAPASARIPLPSGEKPREDETPKDVRQLQGRIQALIQQREEANEQLDRLARQVQDAEEPRKVLWNQMCRLAEKISMKGQAGLDTLCRLATCNDFIRQFSGKTPPAELPDGFSVTWDLGPGNGAAQASDVKGVLAGLEVSRARILDDATHVLLHHPYTVTNAAARMAGCGPERAEFARLSDRYSELWYEVQEKVEPIKTQHEVAQASINVLDSKIEELQTRVKVLELIAANARQGSDELA
jgi:chromosome segregation ATPase